MPDGPPSTAIRRRDVALAGHNDRPDIARQGLVDPDPSVRAVALGALARLDELDGDLLINALGDDAVVARRAAELAAALPAEPLLDAALLELLGSDDATVVEVAAWALGERHQEDDGPHMGDLVSALTAVAADHADSLCREAAVAALGATAHPDALPAILKATGDKTTVRRRAVIALASYEGPEVDAALAEALRDRDWQVRQAAEDLGAVSDDGP